MGEVSRYVPGPYNGISQVAPQTRLEGTCETMENCTAQIPTGLQKRPPFEFLSVAYASGLTGSSTMQEIPTGDPATDVALIFNNNAGVVTPRLHLLADGSFVPCSISSDAQDYLNAGSPQPDLDLYAKTVEDTTFIANRKVTPAVGVDVNGSRPFEAVIWVKLGAFGRQYSITVNPAGGTPVTSSYRPDDGTHGEDTLGVGTDRVAQAIYDGTVISGSGGTHDGGILTDLTSQGFTVTLVGTVILVSHPTVDFSIVVKDDQGGTAMVAIKGSVQRFSDLPSVAFPDFTVRIAQEVTGANSDYYVKFVPSGSVTTGTWEEVLAPDTPFGLDPATMPIAIKNTAGVWSCDVLPWGRRTTGTEALSPDPDFIGSPIQALAWWRGRLVIVYHGGEYLSASDDPFKFYTTTLTTVVDSDPIGLLTPADEKTFFTEVGVFDRQLVALANKVQAVTSSDVVPKPGQVQFEQIGDNECSGSSRPQSAGKKIYFTNEDTTSTHVFELSTDRLSGQPVAEDMTLSVPTLLPPGLTHAATRKKDFFTVRGLGGSSRLYTHTFRYSDQQRAQNAWHPWTLPDGLLCGGMFFKGSKLYLLAATAEGIGYLLTLDMAQGLTDPGGRVLTYLDRRVSSADLPVAGFADGETFFDLPYPTNENTIGAVCAPGGAFPEGYAPRVTSRSGDTIALEGDWRGYTMRFGDLYDAYFDPSEWFMVGQDQRPILTGSLALTNLLVDVAEFSTLSISVTVRGRDARVTEFEGVWPSDITTPINAAPKSKTRRLDVPLGGPSPDVTVRFSNSSHLGFTLLGYEWVGDWTQRGIRRVS